MLVHKGGQIDNVQLITGLRIAEMSQLQNCSVMCTLNGSYCENGKKREKKSWGRGMCTKNGSYCEKKKKSGGQGVDVNGEVKLLRKCKKKKKNYLFFYLIFFFFFFLGGGGGGGGGVGFFFFFFFFWGGVRVDVN